MSEMNEAERIVVSGAAALLCVVTVARTGSCDPVGAADAVMRLRDRLREHGAWPRFVDDE